MLTNLYEHMLHDVKQQWRLQQQQQQQQPLRHKLLKLKKKQLERILLTN